MEDHVDSKSLFYAGLNPLLIAGTFRVVYVPAREVDIPEISLNPLLIAGTFRGIKMRFKINNPSSALVSIPY